MYIHMSFSETKYFLANNNKISDYLEYFLEVINDCIFNVYIYFIKTEVQNRNTP